MRAFGLEQGALLLRQLKQLEADCYLSDAHVLATDMSDMANRCARDFRARRPDVPAEVVDVLVWCYTFDYR